MSEVETETPHPEKQGELEQKDELQSKGTTLFSKLELTPSRNNLRSVARTVNRKNSTR